MVASVWAWPISRPWRLRGPVWMPQSEAAIGIERANAALREAIGIGRDCLLVVAQAARLPDPVPNFDLHELVTLALDRRGEMVQASSAEQVTNLEIYAQGRSHKIQ